MTKTSHQQRIQKIGSNVALEQTIVSDDSLLPSPKELEGYQNINPDIIPWLLKQTELEQLHRHKMDTDKVKILKGAVANDRIYLIFFLSLVLIFIGLSAWFIYIDKDISGSIFGVLGIVGAAYLAKKFFYHK